MRRSTLLITLVVFPFLLAWAVHFRATFGALPPTGGRSMPAHAATSVMTLDEHELESQIRDIGLQQKADAVGVAVNALNHPSVSVRRRALWCLARLAYQPALPAIDALAQPRPGEVVQEAAYARVVAAQIRATASGPARDATALEAQMRSVLNEVGLSPTAAAGILRRADENDRQSLWLARFAAAQLADMALAAADHGVSNAAAASPLDLSLHPMARVKAESSRYPRPQRIALAVDTLAARHVQQPEDNFLIQALINEGAAATPVILAKLKGMNPRPQDRIGPGFAFLFRALEGIGGAEATEAVAAFLTHPHARVRAHAEQSYSVLVTGKRRNWATPF
ncbi:MAG: hypothetical protein HY321_07465 [Armatimonadetes bacterium]|nr:hypothetical protein [Armatimonadota bacterium]